MDINYTFEFDNGRIERFELKLDDQSCALDARSIQTEIEPWMDLGYHQCPNCTLSTEEHPQCPIAYNLNAIVKPFEDVVAITVVNVRASLREREVVKRSEIQDGLSSLIGLVMATSGCPILDKLRPMAFTHQPFATTEETIYRAISTYIMAQHLKLDEGQEANLDIEGLAEIYQKVSVLNESFTKRLDDFFEHENINSNALIILDTFATLASFSIEFDWKRELLPLFSAYLE